MSEKEKYLISCEICKEICKRGVSVKCCGTKACRACATKKVTSTRSCWNESCRVPMKTDDLINDENLRTAVNNFKAGIPIPEDILKQLEACKQSTTGKQQNNQNPAQKRPSDSSDNQCPTKIVKTEASEIEYKIVKKWQNGKIVEVKELLTKDKKEELKVGDSENKIKIEGLKDGDTESKIKIEVLKDGYSENKIKIEGLKVGDSENKIKIEGLKDNDCEDEASLDNDSYTIKKWQEMEGVTKIFVSLSCMASTTLNGSDYIWMLELSALNSDHGQQFYISPKELPKYEDGMEKFCTFIRDNFVENESIALIFYTSFELCTFLKYGGAGKKCPYIRSLLSCGVKYVCNLRLSSPVKPLDEVVDSKSLDYDIKSAPNLVAKYCQENPGVDLQCYEMQDFNSTKEIRFKLQVEIMFDKKKTEVKSEVVSAFNLHYDGVKPVIWVPEISSGKKQRKIAKLRLLNQIEELKRRPRASLDKNQLIKLSRESTLREEVTDMKQFGRFRYLNGRNGKFPCKK